MVAGADAQVGEGVGQAVGPLVELGVASAGRSRSRPTTPAPARRPARRPRSRTDRPGCRLSTLPRSPPTPNLRPLVTHGVTHCRKFGEFGLVGARWQHAAVDYALTPELVALQRRGRARWAARRPPTSTCARTPGSSATPPRSRVELAERGWLGMTWPVEEGGARPHAARAVRRVRGADRRRRAGGAARGSPTARSARRSSSSAPTSSGGASCPTSSPARRRGASA